MDTMEDKKINNKRPYRQVFSLRGQYKRKEGGDTRHDPHGKRLQIEERIITQKWDIQGLENI